MLIYVSVILLILYLYIYICILFRIYEDKYFYFQYSSEIKKYSYCLYFFKTTKSFIVIFYRL